MAKNRKNHFGPALSAAFFFTLITGSAVGYVWQKNKIDELGQTIRQREASLQQWTVYNQQLARLCATLNEPKQIETLAKQLNLGLQPLQPEQVVRIVETPAENPVSAPRRQWAVRTDGQTQ